MKIGLVVSTIGRPDALGRLFESITRSSLAPVRIVVSDQDRSGQTLGVCLRWASRLPVLRVPSTGGAAAGRNVGLASLGECDVVGFPDDDVWYAKDTLERACIAFDRWSADVVTGRLAEASGEDGRWRWPRSVELLTHENAWRLGIEATMFFRRSQLQGMTLRPDLGVGAPTPWQSGEGTELLLRGLSRGWVGIYDGSVRVYEDCPVYEPSRYRAYGRGTGRVIAMRDRRRALRALAGPLARASRAALLRDRVGAERGIQAAVGVAEGLLGRTIGRS